MSFSPRSILITGASSGMGAATADLLAEQGARVFTAQRGTCRHECITADFSDPAAPARVIDAIRDRAGQLDILVNNAGVMREGTVEEMPLDDWHMQLQVNLTAPFLLIRHAMPLLRMQGGAIVNLSSAAAILGAPALGVEYAASKGAIDVLTIGLGREVAAEGIRVNAVRPGIIDTEIHDSSGIPGRVKMMRDVIPMKREGTAEEVADAIVWLTSDQSTYVTGTIVTVAGGRC